MFGVAVGHIQTDHVDLELFQAEWGYKLYKYISNISIRIKGAAK